MMTGVSLKGWVLLPQPASSTRIPTTRRERRPAQPKSIRSSREASVGIPKPLTNQRPGKRNEGNQDTVCKSPRKVDKIDSIPARGTSTRIRQKREWLAEKPRQIRGNRRDAMPGHTDSWQSGRIHRGCDRRNRTRFAANLKSAETGHQVALLRNRHFRFEFDQQAFVAFGKVCQRRVRRPAVFHDLMHACHDVSSRRAAVTAKIHDPQYASPTRCSIWPMTTSEPSSRSMVKIPVT